MTDYPCHNFARCAGRGFAPDKHRDSGLGANYGNCWPHGPPLSDHLIGAIEQCLSPIPALLIFFGDTVSKVDIVLDRGADCAAASFSVPQIKRGGYLPPPM
jgi:hypothetical protein